MIRSSKIEVLKESIFTLLVFMILNILGRIILSLLVSSSYLFFGLKDSMLFLFILYLLSLPFYLAIKNRVKLSLAISILYLILSSWLVLYGDEYGIEAFYEFGNMLNPVIEYIVSLISISNLDVKIQLISLVLSLGISIYIFLVIVFSQSLYLRIVVPPSSASM